MEERVLIAQTFETLPRIFDKHFSAVISFIALKFSEKIGYALWFHLKVLLLRLVD